MLKALGFSSPDEIIRIQGHNLLLVEKGHYSVQLNYTSFDIHVGQSRSFFVTMDQNAKLADLYKVKGAYKLDSQVLTATYKGCIEIILLCILEHGPLFLHPWIMLQLLSRKWYLVQKVRMKLRRRSLSMGLCRTELLKTRVEWDTCSWSHDLPAMKLSTVNLDASAALLMTL
ncbi:unnamed protein product [Linum tenue]|uniref:Plastocyanin-like domain-containing protein n=1 Tax=Linum tenue TaxID=586396 RepID=A0AAV0IBC8_9ROSI|nr:unnamed protein product [Linum tenue]